jgi:arylsulfatase
MGNRPNIVFILTDQQRYDSIAALGFPYVDTPNLDRLVNEGTSFDRSYVTAPSCSPSRASLFSGTYPHTNGVFRNDEAWNYCWVRDLNAAGYRCVNVGKMHTWPVEGAFGFHERHVTENKDRAHPNLPFYLDNWDKAIWTSGFEKPSRQTYKHLPDYSNRLGSFTWALPKNLHPDVFVPQTACLWLDRYSGDEPFFLQIGIPGPHPPYDPMQSNLDAYQGRDFPAPIRDYDLDSQPKPLRDLRRNHLDNDHDAVVHLENPTDAQVQSQRAHYFANVTMIDEQVGLVIEALERRGVLDDTVIIFASDHGDCLNDHGHSQKWNMYEQSVHVPTIFWGAGIPAGRRVTDLVALMDIGPTVLEISGVTPPIWMEAQSLCPYFGDTPPPRRDCVFAEHARDAILTGTEFMTMVMVENWKLVHFVDCDEGQLFDLTTDPGERKNLWDDPAHAVRKAEMIIRILKWRIQSDLKTQTFLNALSGTESRRVQASKAE